MTTPLRVLILEDRLTDAELLLHELRKAGFEPDWQRVESESDYLSALDPTLDLILADYSLPQFDGLRALRLLRARGLDLPFILVSGTIGEDMAVSAMKEGADDYLLKDRLTRLGPAVKSMLEQKRLRDERKLAEGARRNAEARYRILFDQSPNGVLLIDPDTGKTIEANGTAHKQLGYTHEEFAALRISDYDVLETPEETARRMQKIIREGSDDFETLHRTKSGEIRNVHVWAKTVQLSARSLFYVIFQDITERKQAEEAIRLMSDTQREITYLDSLTDIYHLVGKKIQELTGDGYVAVSTIDRQIQAVKVFEVYGFEKIHDMLIRTFRLDPFKAVYYLKDMTEYQIRQFTSGKLERYENGLFGILTGKVPKPICEGIERLIGVTDIYTMGFAWEDTSFGGITILSKHDITPHRDTIQTIMNQAAVAMKRISAEAALREADQQAIREYERLLERLIHLAQAVGTARDLTSVFRGLREFAEASVPCNGLFVSLYNPERQERICMYSGGDGEEDDVSTLPPMPMNDSPQSRAIATGQIVVTDDLQTALAGKPVVNLGMDKDPRLPQSSLAVPLTVLGRVIGVFEVQSVQPADYKPEHMTAMRMAANLAAIATENVQLLERERRALEEVRSSEERFRALIENATDLILVLNPDGTLRYVSPSVVQILGFAPDEIIGRNIADFVHSDELPAALEAIAIRARTPGVADQASEFRVRHKDGSFRTMEVIGNNLLDNPAISGIVVNARDVTERKQAEEALRRAEENYRNIFENSLNGIFQSTSEGRFFMVNPALVQIWGYNSPEDLLASVTDIARQVYVDPERRAEHTRLLKEQGGSVIGFEYQAYRKDGTTIWVSENVRSVVDSDDALLYYEGTVEDISDRKRAEEALKLFRTLIDRSSDAIEVLDPQTGRFLDVNEKGCLDLGYSREEFLALSIFDIETAVDQSGFLRVVEDLRKQNVLLWEGFHRRKDGSTYPVEANIKYLRLDRDYIITVVRDVTERKQAEAQTRLQSSALNAAANSIMITNRDGAIEWVNPAFTTFTGYTAEEAIGRNPRDLVRSGKQDKAFYKELWDTILAGGVWRSELINRRKDGSFYTEEETITPLKNADGDITHFIAIKQDITSRKQAEERIRRQLEHLTALSAIDRVIAGNFDLKLSLTEILTHTTTELGIDAADILILNFDSKMLEFGAARGFRSKAVRKAQVHLGESYAGRAVLERQLVQIPNLRDEPDELFLTTHLAGEDFICYYGVPLISKGKVKGVLEVFHRSRLEPDPEWLDFLNTLAGQAAIAIDDAQLFESLQRSNTELTLAYDTTIEGWSHALDLRDKETEGHTQRVTEMTLKLARAFGLSEAELVQVRWGSLLHDIGKMGVPDGILLKPGPLTDEEWVAMKKHPTFAYELLAPIGFLRLALDIPYCHHEKWDGTGYPRGLKGEQIPLTARIFAVVDVWDALTSDRPYRKAWPHEKVIKHIHSLAGTHFDPKMVDVFLREYPSSKT